MGTPTKYTEPEVSPSPFPAPTRFAVQRKPMVCGSAAAESREYKMVVDLQQRVWLYSLETDSPGGAIYVHDPNKEGSQGFAGRTLTFKIGKCGSYSAPGPWHSNADALFSETGVDLRDKHLTFVVVAKRQIHILGTYEPVLEDLLHIDKEPTLGPFQRYKGIAQEWADKLDAPVYYYSESTGGSSSGPIVPSQWTPERTQAHWKAEQKRREAE